MASELDSAHMTLRLTKIGIFDIRKAIGITSIIQCKFALSTKKGGPMVASCLSQNYRRNQGEDAIELGYAMKDTHHAFRVLLDKLNTP